MKQEDELYNEAIIDMDELARYQLANYVAHDYKIQSTQEVTILQRKDSILIITKDGHIYKGTETAFLG